MRNDSSGQYDIGVRRSRFEWNGNEKRGQVLDDCLAVPEHLEEGIRVKMMSQSQRRCILGEEVKRYEAYMMDVLRQSMETR